MEKLGYIISSNRIRNVSDFIEVTTDHTIYDKTVKPVMVIGLENARKIIPKFSILQKEPTKGKFWTFGKTEKRGDYEKDLNNFYKYVLNDTINKIKYYYLNFTKLPKNKICDFLLLLENQDRKYVYIYKDMIYLYHRNYVLGISLKMLKYMGINVDKYLKRIRKNRYIKIFDTEMNINQEMKQFVKNRRYLIPYFLSLTE